MSNSGLRNYAVEIAVGTGALIALSAYAVKRMTEKRKKITRIIDTMEVFKKNTVHMKDPDLVEEIVSLLIKGGASRLQVVSDFDATISRSHINGVKCSSSFGAVENCPYVSEENKYQANLLCELYHPIECDPNLSVEEKTPYMKEWYDKSCALMSKCGIRKENMEGIVSMSNVVLREGSNVLFQLLYKHDIPVLVFSAGIGDVIKGVLKHTDLLFPNVKIIANCFEFDEQGKLVGFKGEQIHTFNKNQFSVENDDYFGHLKTRYNVILMGDTLGDINMTDGMKETNCILKIGFLNWKIEENLPKFMEAYDIVLTDDQTMDVVNEILHTIL